MAQKSITSFFKPKPQNPDTSKVKNCEESPKKNICEENGVSRSPSPAKSGKRKRRQIIYSDDEEESGGSPITEKSPPKKKIITNGNVDKKDVSEESEDDTKENETRFPKEESSCSSQQISTSPLKTPKRITATRSLPAGSPLHPNIIKVLDEQRNKNKLEGEKSGDSSGDEDFKQLPNDSESDSPMEEAEVIEPAKDIPVKKSKASTKSEIKDKKSTPKGATKKKTSPKSKLSQFKKQPSKSAKETSEVKKSDEIKTEEKSDQVEKEDNGCTEEKSPKEESEKVPSPKKKQIHSFFGVKKDKDGKPSAPPADPGASYDPSKSKYHPIEDAFWKHGEKVPYLALARTLEEVEGVKARLKMIEILSNYLRSVVVLSPDDLLPSVYLCLNKLAPAYHSLELGVADTTLYKTIAQTTGRSVAQIKSDVAAAGDVGIVAEQSKSTQRVMFKPAPLTVRGVFDKLKEIAQMSGQASMGKKVDKIQSMFVACRFSEARFLMRSLAGKLRIGLAEQSVLQAIALACVTTPPCQGFPPEKINVASTMSAEAFKSRLDEEALIIKTTYCECPNYDMIIPVILREGVKALPQHCRLTPGIPLKPMLAHPTKGVSEVLQRFDGLKFTCEWKYDGERAQIHLSEDGKVSVYSRNQEDNTSKYPDIVGRLPSCLGSEVKSCVLDTEAVAWDCVNKRIQPFQVLSTRKKKDCKEDEIKVQVCVYMFDLLYLNGEPLVQRPLAERRKLLKENFRQVEEQLVFATSLDTTTMEEVQDFLEESVKGNCEGLMVKTLESDATYEIAKRSRNWLKLKKDYLDGVGDTLDLVVVGGYFGKGKRAGLYGGFLLACYHPDTEEYQSVCKLGTGFSDEALQKHTETLKKMVIPSPRPYFRYDTSHEPDEWFDATAVWEVKCADLSLSPVHRAAVGIVDPDKGISLRFPRFIRIRDDKTAEEATSAQQIADMYQNQDQIKNQQGDSNKIAEEDFY
ncbi:DNA ligase 1 isoform X1 [Homalodisca vitripennis]|uniref:DNA ligase 1 isoform X1 n=1 Tax=Homalodisca vitripennis TaxID=197043 RepID=UPI001EEB3316|nr:DNA ligase 1 isoform X1 [Homalodisca vitripennis]